MLKLRYMKKKLMIIRSICMPQRGGRECSYLHDDTAIVTGVLLIFDDKRTLLHIISSVDCGRVILLQ